MAAGERGEATDRVALDLPMHPGYEHVAAIAATDIARRRRFRPGQVDNLRRAVALAIEILRRRAHPDDRLQVVFDMGAGILVTYAELLGDGPALTAQDRAELDGALSTLVDRHDTDGRALRLELHAA